MKLFKLCFVILVLAFFATAGVATAGTLDEVRSKGFIQAGANGDLFGFGNRMKKVYGRVLMWTRRVPLPPLYLVMQAR